MNQKSVVFVSLLIDLLAFTLILPLFPKIFDYYASNENDSTYKLMQYSVNKFRELIAGPAQKDHLNSVLFGGMIGSLFSFLQFVSSAIVGAASDLFGRKRVLLVVMTGTLVSYMTWSMSSVFFIFLISRIVGGITKANVSLAIAIMTDLTDKSTRSSAMALVGIAFSLGFLIGPSIGAVFSSKLSSNSNIYLYPSYLAISLAFINLIFVALFYEESLPASKRAKSWKKNLSQAVQFINPFSLFNYSPVQSVKGKDLEILRNVGLVNFLYLFLYSGLEFTLTFLVHHRFNYDSVQQGKMFLFIGVVMTLLQGGYVRRLKPGRHVKASIVAILLLIPAFVIIGVANTQIKFYLGLLLYCYSSAVVVSCLTTVMADYGNDDEKGTVTGIGRSLGALARAFGPICSSMIYWLFGASFAYILGGALLLLPLSILIRVETKMRKSVEKVH